MTPALAAAIQAVIDELANHPAVLVRGPVERLRAAMEAEELTDDWAAARARNLAPMILGNSWHHINASIGVMAVALRAAERRGAELALIEVGKATAAAGRGLLRPESVV